jgi:hypothetical protein
MAYVYRHIRLDKNEPFYIGIGSDDKYYRANKKSQRNIHWKRVVAKTPYEIEIMLDNLTWDEACEKEREFIKLYGRVNLKTGPLTNMTDGGDGTLGLVVSDETREKLSKSIKEWHKTYVVSDENRLKSSLVFKELIKKDDFIKKRIEALRNSEKLKQSYILRTGKPSGYKHNDEAKKLISLSKIGRKMSKDVIDAKSKKVIQLDLNDNVIKIWDSTREIQRELGLSQGNISRCCNNEYKQSYGYKWKYLK